MLRRTVRVCPARQPVVVAGADLSPADLPLNDWRRHSDHKGSAARSSGRLAQPTRDDGERPDDVIGVASNLPVGEAKAAEPGGGVPLIAKPITCLLGRRSVIAEPIGFDDKTKIGPEEVDLKPVHPLTGERQR
jgi:hypothetical protein